MGERVKLWLVGVRVKLTVVVCDMPPVPLGVAVMVIVCAPVGITMLAVVAMVNVTGWESVPSSEKLAGLKLQVAPAGTPVQLLEVKVMLWWEPFTGAMVKTAVADCTAGAELGVRGLVV